jgi:hypothetical protein
MQNKRAPGCADFDEMTRAIRTWYEPTVERDLAEIRRWAPSRHWRSEIGPYELCHNAHRSEAHVGGTKMYRTPEMVKRRLVIEKGACPKLFVLQWPDVDFERGLVNNTKSLEQTKQGFKAKGTKSDT